MEKNLATLCKGVRLERSLNILLSLTDLDNLKQSRFTEYEINLLRKLAPEKLLGQKISKSYVALQILD